MRVIAGTARSLPLKTIDGPETRPTTDRIKETLFNMLQMDVPGCRFLDLYAGSGAIGIEALSRGASKVVFVDKSKACTDVIKANLKFTRLEEDAEVITGGVLETIAALGNRNERFDIIFMDPPYDHELEKQVLLALQGRSFVDEDTVIIVEASKHTDFSYVEEYGYRIARRKEYKTNLHLFLQKQ